MPIAYPLQNQLTQVFLSKEEVFSLVYHDIFDYPLTAVELIKWSAGKKIKTPSNDLSADSIKNREGFYYLGNREGIVLKRLMRKRISLRKIEIAKEGVKVLSLIPTIKMIAITGALAMENASGESDIDLLIITKKGTLWTSRTLAYLLIRIFGLKVRRPADAAQKDRLCLNMWLSEEDMDWDSKDRNSYTAHEIAQIKPLVNKDKAYEKFILKNKWTQDYWPNAVSIRNYQLGTQLTDKTVKPSFIVQVLEKVAFSFQYRYMKSRITREIITPTRALFHPVDWGKYVLSKLKA